MARDKDTVVHLYLDLEDTIIHSWAQPDVINAKAIATFIDRLESRQLTVIPRIFSWAIASDKDKDTFARTLKEPLEELLLIEIGAWPSIPEVRAVIEKWSGLRYQDTTDFMQVCGKHDAFVKYCLATHMDTSCVLLDDCVPHRTVIDHTRELSIELVPLHTITNEAPPAAFLAQ